MDSSPEAQPEEVQGSNKVRLKDIRLSNKGRFTIPEQSVFGINIKHKDIGVYSVNGVTFTSTIYVTESGIRSTVDSAARKALNLQKGDIVDITHIRALQNKTDSEV